MPHSDGPQSLHAIVEKLAKDYPDRLAVDGLDGKPWSYSQLYSASLKMAVALRSELVECGEVTGYSLSVGLCAPRGPRWVAVCVAASVLGVPFVPMVQDLHANTKNEGEIRKIAATTRDRNSAILNGIRPAVLVVDETSTPRETIDLAVSVGTSKIVDINSLLDGATQIDPNEPLEPLQSVKRESPLCLLYTGGTTKASKCAVVSQGMLAHEFVSYPLIVPESRRGELLLRGPRVLQQSSSYWGATCIGQLSLSLALRGCLVMVDTSSRSSLCDGMASMDLRTMITRLEINVIGVVPSQLAATTLDEKVQESLIAVFTWGEKLTAVIGDEWSAKIPIVIELLVATEYWLSMYRVVTPSTPTGPVFTVVPGVRVTTLSEDETTTGLTKGELLLAGPSVTETGYIEAAENQGLFLDTGDGRFFRTKDLIQVLQWRSQGSVETLRYLGRSDMFIKLGGQWVDLEALQEKIVALPCIKEAVLLQQEQQTQEYGVEERLGGIRFQHDGERASVHAFIIMKPFRLATTAEVQRLLPSGNVVRVHWLALETLPRHSATCKIDRRSLLGMVRDDDIVPAATEVEVARCFGYLARWSIITLTIAVVYYLALGLTGMFLAAHFNMTYWVAFMVDGNIWITLEKSMPPYVADGSGFRRLLRSALAAIFWVLHFFASELKQLDRWTKCKVPGIGGVVASLLFTGGLLWAMGLVSSSAVWCWSWQGVVVVSSGLWLGKAFPRLDQCSRDLSFWRRCVHGVVLVVQFNVLWWTTIGRSIEKDSWVADWTSEPGARRWVPSWLRNCSVDLRLYGLAECRKGRTRRSCRSGVEREEFLMDSVLVSPRDLRHCRDREEGGVEGIFDSRRTVGEEKASGYEESYYYSWMDAEEEPRECPLPSTIQISTQQWAEMRREAVENIDRWYAGRYDGLVLEGEDYATAKGMLEEEERRQLRSPSTSVGGQLEVSETSTTPTLGAGDDESSDSDVDEEWYAGGEEDAPVSVEAEPKVELKSAKPLAKRLALLVERQLTFSIEDFDADVVSSIDSLGAVQLAHSIRTELRMTGLLLTVGDVLKCRSVNDLVAVVEAKSVAGGLGGDEEEDEGEGDGGKWTEKLSRILDGVTGVDPTGRRGPKAAGIPVQVWGWQGVCAWMLEWHGGSGGRGSEEEEEEEVDLFALQAAVQAVVSRQASMRVSNDIGIGYYTFMNEGLSVQGMVKYMALTKGGRFFSWIAAIAYAVGRWVLWPLWGRIHITPSVEGRPGSVRVREFNSREALRRWVHSEKRHGFRSPLGIDIVQLDESLDGCGPVRTFVRVFVTHAFSDGFSVVPLLSDLNEAYAAVRRGSHRGPRNRLLPPLRVSGAQVQSGRLRRTLMDRARDLHGDTLYPCYTVDHTTVPQQGFGHCVKLLPSIHLVLHSVGRRLGAPLDVVLLAAIVLASVRERGWRRVAKATLVVPLRDGPTEHQLVGLFADLRNIDIPLEDVPEDNGQPCATSVLNLVLTLRHIIKFRRWTIPTPLSSCERLLVNLLPAQFPSETDTSGRFEQNLNIIPLPQGSSVSATRAMDIACDQTSRCSWALRFKCRQPDYTREDLANWLRHFQDALRDMVVDPMRPLYH